VKPGILWGPSIQISEKIIQVWAIAISPNNLFSIDGSLMKRTTEIQANFKVIQGKYSLSDRVGGGSFGDVFIGTDLKTGAKVCFGLSENNRLQLNSKRSLSIYIRPCQRKLRFWPS
jgi:hypothetical protein